LRLLYVIDSLSPNGAEQSLASLAVQYKARGLQLDVAYLKEVGGLRETLGAEGAGLFWIGRRESNRIGRVRTLRDLISIRKPDLVHTTLVEADLVGRIAGTLARVPVVSSLVNDGYGPEHLDDPSIVAWKLWGARMVDSATVRLVRRFHALTHHVADVMARRLHIPGGRIDVIPRGRDAAAMGARSPERRDRVRKALWIEGDERLILAVARQEHQKGLDVLLRAMPGVLEALPDARLMLAGREGQQTPLLRALTKQLSLEGSVPFLGVREDVPDLLAAADVFVFPSRFEGFGGTLLEAMALQAPIVASDLAPIREVVGNQDVAVLVPPNNPSVLCQAVVATLLDHRTAARRTDRARARFLRRFTIDQVADEMVAFYERAMSTGKASGTV
jgi:glycosyltransferase involved in cell wall biosynthesis